METKVLNKYLSDFYPDIRVDRIVFNKKGDTILTIHKIDIIVVPYEQDVKFTTRLHETLKAYQLMGLI